MNLKEGQQITAPFLNGMAKVKKFERKKGFCLLEVVLKRTNEFKTLRISDEQCQVIELMADNISASSDSGEDLFFLSRQIELDLPISLTLFLR